MVEQADTSITLEWVLDNNGGSVVTGYKLYQTNVTDGGEFVVYDGTNIPTVTSHKINGLYSGHEFIYRVTALNRVGESDKSPFSQVIMAATVPGRPEPPVFLHATSSIVNLQLKGVDVTGGTVVTSYVLYADDGDNS